MPYTLDRGLGGNFLLEEKVSGSAMQAARAEM